MRECDRFWGCGNAITFGDVGVRSLFGNDAVRSLLGDMGGAIAVPKSIQRCFSEINIMYGFKFITYVLICNADSILPKFIFTDINILIPNQRITT